MKPSDYKSYNDGFYDGQEQNKKKYANAVKALIIHNDKLLILRNALTDKYRPGEGDYPGGRLELGEDPFIGLHREVEEELGKEFADVLQIGQPLDIKLFKRLDGQIVTLMSFYCTLKNDAPMIISPEHMSAHWVDIDNAKDFIELSSKNINITSNIMIEVIDKLIKIDTKIKYAENIIDDWVGMLENHEVVDKLSTSGKTKNALRQEKAVHLAELILKSYGVTGY